MRHHPLRQPQDATKAAASPQPTRTTRPSAHPILQRQALLGNQATNQWLDEQPQEAEAMQPSLPSPPSPFRGLSQELNSQQLIGKIQAKLVIGESNDGCEQEADRVATVVTNYINNPLTQLDNDSQTIKRRAILGQSELKSVPVPQQVSVSDVPLSRHIEEQINSARNYGRPLPLILQTNLGKVMQADFSRVRLHTDTPASQLNNALHSRAFTVGHDIFFGQGEYQPSSWHGQELLAHELTHVIQQSHITEPYHIQMKGKRATRLKKAASAITKDVAENAAAGAVSGGILGAVGGAVGGTAAFPGIGTVSGALLGGGVGAVGGGVAGALSGLVTGARSAYNAYKDTSQEDQEKQEQSVNEKFEYFESAILGNTRLIGLTQTLISTNQLKLGEYKTAISMLDDNDLALSEDLFEAEESLSGLEDDIDELVDILMS